MVTHLGYRVFTCDICGTQFRFKHVAWPNPTPSASPTFIHGDLYDPGEDTAMRHHATTHGGFLDKQLAYTGPTTWTTHKEMEKP